MPDPIQGELQSNSLPMFAESLDVRAEMLMPWICDMFVYSRVCFKSEPLLLGAFMKDSVPLSKVLNVG